MLVGVRTAPFLGQGLLNVQFCSASAGWDFLQDSPSMLSSPGGDALLPSEVGGAAGHAWGWGQCKGL